MNHPLYSLNEPCYSSGLSISSTVSLLSSSSALSTASSSSSSLSPSSRPCHHDAKQDPLSYSAAVTTSSASSSFDKKCLIHRQTTTMEEKKKQRRNVQFSTVLILEFPQALGCCTIPRSGGAPIGLKGFEPCRTPIQYDLDTYEEHRRSKRNVEQESFHLTVETRSRLLVELGYTLDDIFHASLEGFKIQQDRIETQVIIKLEELRRRQNNQIMTNESNGRRKSRRGRGGKYPKQLSHSSNTDNDNLHHQRHFLARAFVSTKRNLIKSINRRT